MNKIFGGIVFSLFICAQAICAELDYTACKSWDDVIQLETAAIESCTDDLDLALLYSKRGTSFLFKGNDKKAFEDLDKANQYMIKIDFSEKIIEPFIEINIRYCFGMALICDKIGQTQHYDSAIKLLVETIKGISFCPTCPARLIKIAEALKQLASQASTQNARYTLMIACDIMIEHTQKRCDLLKQH